MKESDAKAVYQNSSLKVLPDVSIVEIKILIKEILSNIHYSYCLYGSSDDLEFDVNGPINDYDIFASKPVSIFEYISEILLKEFPSIVIRGIEGIHKGTYRLRISEVTLLDISVVTDDIMEKFTKWGRKIDGTYSGFSVPRLFKFGEACKLLLKPGVSFAPLPYVTDSDRRKWGGQI